MVVCDACGALVTKEDTCNVYDDVWCYLCFCKWAELQGLDDVETNNLFEDGGVDEWEETWTWNP